MKKLSLFKKNSYIFNKPKYVILLFFSILYHANGYSQNLKAKLTGDKWGFVNSEQKLVIPARYDYAKDFDNAGYAIVVQKGMLESKNGKNTSVDTVFLIEKSQKPVATVLVNNPNAPKPILALPFKKINDGIYEIYTPNKINYVKKDSTHLYVSGKKVLSSASKLHLYSAGKTTGADVLLYYCQDAVSNQGNIKDKLIGIDKTGKIRFQLTGTSNPASEEYENYVRNGGFSDGLSLFHTSKTAQAPEGAYGYVNTNGEVIIKPKYNLVTNFSEGYAVAGYFVGLKQKDTGFKCFVIDKTGRETPITELTAEASAGFYSGSLFTTIMGAFNSYPQFSNGTIQMGNQCFNNQGQKVACK